MDFYFPNLADNFFMGTKGSKGKTQSIRFPLWMSEAIDEIAEKGGHTFTDVVIDLLRQELAVMGRTMGIGRESVEKKKAGKTTLKKAAG